MSGVGASSKGRGPASRGYGGYAPREPEGTIWASAAAKPRTKPRTFRSPATDARRVASGEKDARPSGDDARVSEDGFAPIASVSGYGSRAGSVTIEGDERRRGEDEDEERGRGRRRRRAGNFPPRRVINRRTRRRLRRKPVARAPRRGSAPEHVYALFGRLPPPPRRRRRSYRRGGARSLATRRNPADAAIVAGAAKSAALRARAAARAAARAGRQRAWGATSGVGSFFAPRDPAAFDSPPGNDRERRRGGARYRLFARSRRRRRRRRARGWARASARGGGSGGGISVANDAGMGRRVGGGGGWAAKEEPRSAAASGLRGNRTPGAGVGGRRGVGGRGGRRGIGARGGRVRLPSRGRAGGRIEREGAVRAMGRGRRMSSRSRRGTTPTRATEK